MADSVEKTDALENENTNKKRASDKAKTSVMLGNPTAQTNGSSASGGYSSTIFGCGQSFVPRTNPFNRFSTTTCGNLDARTFERLLIF